MPTYIVYNAVPGDPESWTVADPTRAGRLVVSEATTQVYQYWLRMVLKDVKACPGCGRRQALGPYPLRLITQAPTVDLSWVEAGEKAGTLRRCGQCWFELVYVKLTPRLAAALGCPKTQVKRFTIGPLP